MDDVRDLDRRAVVASAAVAERVVPHQLGLPTPCAGWTVADLLAHMTVQHAGFAAAARGHGADPDAWRAEPAEDPVSAYLAASEEVTAAFSEAGVLDREFSLPEISTELTFPGAQAISFHFVDYVVHTWDLAVSLGLGPGLDDELVAAAVPVAERVPAGEARLRPGAAFGPVLPAAAEAPPLHRVLTLLGRSPEWPAVTA
jgi:uncharacterized protein (TIGR03086 family)